MRKHTDNIQVLGFSLLSNAEKIKKCRLILEGYPEKALERQKIITQIEEYTRTPKKQRETRQNRNEKNKSNNTTPENN